MSIYYLRNLYKLAECGKELADVTHLSTRHLVCLYCNPAMGFIPNVLSFSKHFEHLNKHSIPNITEVCCGMCDAPILVDEPNLSLLKIYEHFKAHLKTVEVRQADGKIKIISLWNITNSHSTIKCM